MYIFFIADKVRAPDNICWLYMMFTEKRKLNFSTNLSILLLSARTRRMEMKNETKNKPCNL